MITFKDKVEVFLDGKKVGEIIPVKGGYQYFLKGQKEIEGEIFHKISAAKASLKRRR